MIPTYVVLFIISALLGYFGTSYFPPSKIILGNEAVAFTWVPLIIAFYIGKLSSNLFERTVTSIKVVYFTVFYTKITHPKRIAEDMREELASYLILNDIDEVDNLKTEEAPQPATV